MAAVGTRCKCGAGKRRRAKKLRSVCTYVPTASVVRKAKTQLHGRFVPKSRLPPAAAAATAPPKIRNTEKIADCRRAARATLPTQDSTTQNICAAQMQLT